MQQFRGQLAPYLPSPHEIREACHQIRSEWSPGEREARRVGARIAWRVLVLPHPEFDRRQHVKSM
jgi:hypothetical protein